MSMLRDFRTIALLLCCVSVPSFLCAAPQATSSSGYHLIKKVKLGGTGGWDYLEVDPATHRLFISRGTHVIVVDPDQGKIVGDIPDTQGVHGIAFANKFERGFTTNGRTSNSSIFDLGSLRLVDQATTDKDPDAIIYDPFSERVFTMNGDGNSATAIDAASGKVVGSIPLGGGPEFAAADGKGNIFANLEDKSSLVKFNAKTLKVENTWPLAPCESPSGLAIDAAHQILIVGCHNKLMAFVDGNSGKIIGTVPIGQGVDANRFDPVTGYAFASCGDGTLTIAHEDSPTHFSFVETIETQRGARTMALDYVTHTLYLVSAEFGPAPAATTENPRPRPAIIPDTFTLLVYGK
jgi:DNA-binding beta-propeller fold protein YncE